MSQWYRIQPAAQDVADLLNPEMQWSHPWSGCEDEDPRRRRGVSVCGSMAELATYLAGPGSGIPYGAGQWVIVELVGRQSDDLPLDREVGEYLILPEAITSVTPMGDEFFELIGAAYDRAVSAEDDDLDYDAIYD